MTFDNPVELNHTSVYNLLSKACVSFSNAIYNRLQLADFDCLTEKQIRDLQSVLIVVPDDEYELTMLKHVLGKARFNSRSMHLSVYTTFNCNFACPYCYEKEAGLLHQGDMSIEMADSLLDWLECYLNNRGLTLLHLRLYGGEPLCNIDLIKHIGDRLPNICESNGVDLQAYIVTNASLLDEDIFPILDRLRVSYFQITLDGPKNIHDEMRPFTDGTGSYDMIMRNVNAVVERGHEVMIRVNVGKGNIDHLHSLVDDLERKIVANGRVSIDFSSIFSECWGEGGGIEAELGPADADKIFEANDYAVSKGFRINNPYLYDHCYAITENNFELDPSGNLFSCASFVGHEKYCLGNIRDNGFNHIYFRLLTTDSFDDECIKCKYLPICLGGCRAEVAMKTGDVVAKSCNKVNFDRLVKRRLQQYYSQPWLCELA